jgi:hypothetical protein
MLKILKYLILIRFRKIFAKDDFFAIGLLLIAIAVLSYFFQINYKQKVDYLLLFVIQIIVLQTDRKDVSFLKLNPNFRIILFLEYLILSLPILILLLFNQKANYILGYLLLIFGITFINKSASRALKYPFKMFDVFWTISFRKYKLFLLIPVFGFIVFMGFKYQNPNLQYAVLLALGIVLCIPSNEREKLNFIKSSSFIGKNYLLQQIKTTCYNSIFVLIPMAIVFAILKEFDKIILIPLLLIFPIVNLLFKYVFFDRIIVHNLAFAFFIVFLVYGFPLIFIPILYFKSIKNLKIIQNA